MNKKTILKSLAAAAIITTGISPTVFFAKENTVSNKIVQTTNVTGVTLVV
ncbi:hypothetical protein [Bacillus thuringiensis]|nr:hypothetical protein [Bacillus thuringiensis]